MDSVKEEWKLLSFTYLLCLVCFFNLAILKQPFDKSAVIIAAVTCVLIGYSHFIIRRFFPDGDKYIFIFSAILSVIGIVILYRLNTADSIKQVIWFAVGVTGYILIVVLFPDLNNFFKYKYYYMVLTLVFMSLGSIMGTEINGSKNWILIHGMSFQPSEFGKLFCGLSCCVT